MTRRLILILLAILLASCAAEGKKSTTGTPVLTATATPVLGTPASVPTVTRTDVTASPLPTRLTGILEHWREYESALAKSMIPSHPTDEILCEWEVLGQSADEVYVWAACTAIVPIAQSDNRYTSISTVAVIHLGEDGAVLNVERPGGGTHFAPDIREMFPVDAQERFFSNSIEYQRLLDHLHWRREHPLEPPLVVLDVTKMP